MPLDSAALNLCDLSPTVDEFRDDVLAGLRGSPRTLTCKYFYDERGSLLFEQISHADMGFGQVFFVG